MLVLVLGLVGAAGAPAGAVTEVPQPPPFDRWLADLKAEAVGQGIRAQSVEGALAGVRPEPRVIELDRQQPEFSRTLWAYLDTAVAPARIQRGREMLARHRALLADVERTHGVQPRFLVALWGMETSYGSHTGGFRVLPALVTLAHDRRRPDLFRAELLDALRLVDAGRVTPDRMVGSWAGAMGQMQFMPSTFLAHGTDGDADGRIDPWNSLPDAFQSAGRYLASLGWRPGERWGREVRLPPGFDFTQAAVTIEKPLAEWAAFGVARADGGALPVVAGMTGSVLLPLGHTGPAFLVYGNFRVILEWNRSISYAIAAGHLADRLAGQGGLVATPQPEHQPIARRDIVDVQHRLAVAGYDPGVADGMAGPQTRAAVRAFQVDAGLPADGYLSPAVLAAIRRLPR